MGRKKATETQPEGGNAGEANGGEAQPKVTKADAVRTALAEGIDTPQEGIDFIRTRYGIDMAKSMWSSYRSQIKAKEKSGQSGVTRRGGRPRKAAAPQAAASAADMGIVADLAAIKRLVQKLGAGQVRDMIALFE